MSMNIRYKHIFYVLLCMLPTVAHPAIVVTGNTDGPTSFTFSIGSHARGVNGGTFYTGALKPGVAGEFALARTFDSLPCFEPFACEKATINCMTDLDNPLFNAAITQLALFPVPQNMGRMIFFPIAVTQDRPADLFVINDKVGNRLCILALSNVKDADPLGGQTTREIIGVQPFVNANGMTEAIFAAVKPNDSDDFGQPGSGVAVAQFVNVKVEEEQQTVLMQINADPESALPITDAIASPLDITSDSLKIDGDLVSIDNIIDMHYSTRLQRLYVALKVQGGPNATDGGRAVAVGRLVDQKLTFAQIAPNNVFTNADKIVGGTGASTQVSIHNVRTMQTSTSLDYLIVVGGNGAPNNTQQMVFALPLVNTLLTTINEETQGTLANVNIDPEDVFTNNSQDPCEANPQIFRGRVFPEPATEPGQVYTSADVKAVVGGGTLPFGPITDINVSRDAVFVSVADAINDEKPGLFYSQALFDDTGIIASWTPWQRVAGTTDKAFGLSYEQELGSFSWLTGATNQAIKTVKRTQWGMGAEQGLANLATVISGLLPQECAGVQGFFNLPCNTLGLFDISAFIATGLQQVVLIESGQVNNGVLCPNGGDFQTDLQIFTDGQITQNFPVGTVRVVSISGGALADIGPIIAAAIGVNDITQQGYLFVGGACGLAVLAQENGDGWSTATGLGKHFDGLVDGMRFVALDEYCFVRKLIFDEGFLYVLTDTRLDRIDVAASDFSTGTLSVVTVATLADILCETIGTLLDLIVSEKVALLAASTGLFRVGNDANIQTAANSAEVDWTQVEIPEGISVVQFLQSIASTVVPNGLAKNTIGNLYINDAYRGFNMAQVNRYRVESVVNMPVSDCTIKPLPDIHIKDILTAFRLFSGFRGMAIYDGTDLFSSRDRMQTNPPVVFNRNTQLPLDIATALTVSSIVRSSASGAWLISGDFGLRINE